MFRITYFKFALVTYVRKKSDLTSALNCDRYLTLMLSACTCDSSGKNLGTLTYILSETSCVLVIDVIDLFSTELTNLFSLAVVLSEGLLCISIHFPILL